MLSQVGEKFLILSINKENYTNGGNQAGLKRNAGYSYGKADFENVLAKLAKDPKTGKMIGKIHLQTHQQI